MAKQKDILESAQQRLIGVMIDIPHENDEAGRAVKDLVTSTACLLPLVIPEFLPEVDAVILSKAKMEALLYEFGERLLTTQAEWAKRWNGRR